MWVKVDGRAAIYKVFQVNDKRFFALSHCISYFSTTLKHFYFRSHFWKTSKIHCGSFKRKTFTSWKQSDKRIQLYNDKMSFLNSLAESFAILLVLQGFSKKSFFFVVSSNYWWPLENVFPMEHDLSSEISIWKKKDVRPFFWLFFSSYACTVRYGFVSGHQ